jgi:hypothetical protein
LDEQEEMTMRSMGWVLAGLAVLGPVQAAAQAGIEVGPLLGYYRPYGRFEPTSVNIIGLPATPRVLRGRAWGGEARVWFGRRVGGEIQASVSRSTIPQVLTPNGARGPTAARVSTFTAQGLLTLAGTPARDQVWLSAGVGAIRHGGDAYAPYGTPTNLASTIGAGGRLRLLPHVYATAGLSALVYTFDVPIPTALGLNPGSLEYGPQVDVLAHFGLSWMVSGR